MNPSAPAPTRSTWFLLLALTLSAVTANAQELRDEIPYTDGAVFTAIRTGGTLIVGGSFGYIGPATGAAAPIGAVDAVVSDGSGGWFIGGSFTSVLGSPRTNLAHVLANHTLSPLDLAPIDG